MKKPQKYLFSKRLKELQDLAVNTFDCKDKKYSGVLTKSTCNEVSRPNSVTNFLGGAWLGVDLRTDICFEEIRLHAQHLLTFLDSIVKIIELSGEVCDQVMAPWPSPFRKSYQFRLGFKFLCD